MKGSPSLILFQTLGDLHSALDGVGVPYAVTGSVAASYWGLPDLDCEVEVAVARSPGTAEAVARAVKSVGYEIPAGELGRSTDSRVDHRVVVVKERAAGPVWDVEVHLDDSDFLRSVIARRVRVVLDGVQTSLVSVEDFVLFKLRAWDRRDQSQLHDLLLVVGPLDDAYLAAWADKLGVRDRLAEQWRRAGRELRA